jgi:hypothetical protein
VTDEVPHAPRTDRLDPAQRDFSAIITAHEAAVGRGEATYRDPTTGLMVFTSAALAARGHCCECGCRHCPYPVSGPG